MKRILLLLGIILIGINANARKITLTKIGGNGQITLPAGAPANGTPSPTNVLEYKEGVNGLPANVTAWSDYFSYISDCINYDSENDQTTVSYKIDIESPVVTDPMIIGHQYIDNLGKIKSKKNIKLDGNIITSSTPIYNVTINGMNGNYTAKAYVKYADGIKYGSYIPFGTTFNYKKVDNFIWNANNSSWSNLPTSTYYCTFNTPFNSLQIQNTLPNGELQNSYAQVVTSLGNGSYQKDIYLWDGSSWVFDNNSSGTTTTNPGPTQAFIVTFKQYTAPLATGLITLNSPFHTLNNVQPGGVWKNVVPTTATSENFFFCVNSNNVTINNIVCDGNSTNFTLYTMAGDVGRQITHYGFRATNSSNITFNNCNASYMGLDGIAVTGSCENIKINNSLFEFNGRQGFSWTGGNNITVNNSKFNNTGKGILASAPGAGMDIEPEGGFACTNGHFKNCEYKNNAGQGVVAYNSSSLVNSENHTFDYCTFVGLTSWSLWSQHKDMNYNYCSFYGATVHGRGSSNYNDATNYNNCTFSDCYHDENGNTVPTYFGNSTYKPLVEGTGNLENVTYENCTFNAFNGSAMYLVNTLAGTYMNINNCIFNNALNQSEYVILGRANITNNTFNRHNNLLNYAFTNSINILSNNTFNTWGQNGNPPAPTCNDIAHCTGNSPLIPTTMPETQILNSNGLSPSLLNLNEVVTDIKPIFSGNQELQVVAWNGNEAGIFYNYVDNNSPNLNTSNIISLPKNISHLDIAMINNGFLITFVNNNKVELWYYNFDMNSGTLGYTKNQIQLNSNPDLVYARLDVVDGGDFCLVGIKNNMSFDIYTNNVGLQYNLSLITSLTPVATYQLNLTSIQDFDVALSSLNLIQPFDNSNPQLPSTIYLTYTSDNATGGPNQVYLTAFDYQAPNNNSPYTQSIGALPGEINSSHIIAQNANSFYHFPRISCPGYNEHNIQTNENLTISYITNEIGTVEYRTEVFTKLDGSYGTHQIHKCVDAKYPIASYKFYDLLYGSDGVKELDFIISGRGASLKLENQGNYSPQLVGQPTSVPSFLGMPSYQNNSLFPGDCYSSIGGKYSYDLSYSEAFSKSDIANGIEGIFYRKAQPMPNVFLKQSSDSKINLSESVNIFPNPNNGKFSIQFSNIDEASTIVVLDLTGKVIYTKNISKDNIHQIHQIDLKGLSKGMYILNVKNEKDNYSNKIIIE